ncbi:hypothetical protein LguiB_020362 [Lonicera macranthoides]
MSKIKLLLRSMIFMKSKEKLFELRLSKANVADATISADNLFRRSKVTIYFFRALFWSGKTTERISHPQFSPFLSLSLSQFSL